MWHCHTAVAEPPYNVIVSCYTTENFQFSVPAGMRRSTKQPGLVVAESSKPELQPLEKHDRRSLCGMSMEQAEQMCR